MKDYTPQSRIVRDNRTKKTYSAISFTTMQLPAFNEYRDVFYKLNVKQIPDNIYELLTPRGLAFWIFQKKYYGIMEGTELLNLFFIIFIKL